MFCPSARAPASYQVEAVPAAALSNLTLSKMQADRAGPGPGPGHGQGTTAGTSVTVTVPRPGLAGGPARGACPAQGPSEGRVVPVILVGATGLVPAGGPGAVTWLAGLYGPSAKLQMSAE